MNADTPQRAIFDESARYHRFLEYRVRGELDPDRAASAAAAALQAARSSVDRPARIVVAFGHPLWSALAPNSIPSDLRDFETIRGVDGHVAPATQCDLWIWLQGDGEDENVARTLALHAALRDDFELALEQPGFTYFESRDLIDFEDGTANPKDDAGRTEAAVVPGGPGAGGSIVLSPALGARSGEVRGARRRRPGGGDRPHQGRQRRARGRRHASRLPTSPGPTSRRTGLS